MERTRRDGNGRRKKDYELKLKEMTIDGGYIIGTDGRAASQVQRDIGSGTLTFTLQQRPIFRGGNSSSMYEKKVLKWWPRRCGTTWRLSEKLERHREMERN